MSNDHHTPVRAASGVRVRIVHLDGPVFEALAAGDLPSANAKSPVPLSDYIAGPDQRGTWSVRSEQARQDPTSAAWVTGVIFDVDQGVAVGVAGYHGPPDPDGMVEIGYAVDPAYRRCGYARAALETLLDRANQENSVRTVRVTISPENTPSSELVAQYGFAATGEQWDDEDGLEIVYEAATSTVRGTLPPTVTARRPGLTEQPALHSRNPTRLREFVTQSNVSS